jgi:hypothetical protein
MIDAANQLNKYFLENDWRVTYLLDGGIKAEKIIRFPALAGTVLDGSRMVTIMIDNAFRYPETFDGWKKKDIDLREYEDAESAVVALVNKAYGEF